MGIFQRFQKAVEAFRADTTMANPSMPLQMAMLGGSTSSGEIVNPRSAMKVPTLLSGINLLANDISSLPLYLNVRTKNGPQMAVSHPLFRILHDAWSEEITAREGLEHTVRMLITTGNFFNVLNLDADGNITGIVPLYAPNVIIQRLTTDEANKLPVGESTLVFRYYDPVTGVQTVYPSYRIWRGQVGSQYGVIGESSLFHGKDAIGTALAADKASAHLFKQGAITDGYFSPDIGQDLSPTEWEKLVEAWGKGTKGAFKKLVLPPGVKFNPMTLLNAAQAQFIERAKQSGLDMCRILNIPASILDANEKGDTYAASESQRRWYVDHTLRPWLVLLQQSINLRCLSTAERNRYYVEFNTDALLDADLASRYEGYAKALQGGWMTRNEVRKAEGLNPLPGLDVPLVQSNNMGTVNPDGTISPAQKETFSESGAATPAKQAKLNRMAQASADRVVRREQKSKRYEAEFVAEAMCISLEAAQEYVAKRQSGEITDNNAAKVLAEYALALPEETTITPHIEDQNEAIEV